MSEPVATAITVVGLVGTAMSVKTLVEGLKEGNLLKAVVGAVGSYYGVTTLGSQGTNQVGNQVAQGTAQNTTNAAANAATNEAGANLVEKQAGDIMGSFAENATKNKLAETSTGSMINSIAEGGTGATMESSMTNSLAADATNGAIGNGVNQVVKSNSMFDGRGLLRGSLNEATDGFGGYVTKAFEGPANFLKENVGAPMKEHFGDIGKWATDNPELAGQVMQVGGGLLSGYSQQKAKEEEWKRYQREREAMRTRMGTAPDNYVNDYYANSREA